MSAARSTAKILIVDADPSKLQALKVPLTTAAYHVTSATSASFALTTLEREELARLRKEVRQLRLERDVVRKAAVLFAKENA